VCEKVGSQFERDEEKRTVTQQKERREKDRREGRKKGIGISFP